MTHNIAKQLMRMEIHASFPYLIEITDNLGNTYYYANCDDDIEYDNNTYEASCFTIESPEKSLNDVSEASITMSDIDMEWIAKIRNQNQDLRFSIKFLAMIMYNEEGQLHVEPMEEMYFDLTEANWTRTTIEWKMLYDNLMEITVPSVIIDVNNTPSLG